MEAWGTSFTVGLEEELFLVDPATHALVHDAPRLMPIDAGRTVIGHEAYAAQLELHSPPSADAGEAARALAEGRAAARDAGATLLAAGLHPTAGYGDVTLVEGERYRAVEESIRGLMHRTPEAALHVHVGAPDRDAALRMFNGLREWLPLFEALAANSPWWFGRDAGMASARASIVRARPGVDVPPAFADWDDYERTLDAIHAAGGPRDYKLVWWHLRPHPRLGTVEVREMDVQSRLDDAAAIAALVQALARRSAEAPPSRPTPAAALSWSGFVAARDGLRAEIPGGDGLVPVPEVARRAVELATPFARELGGEDALAGIARLLRRGGGADRRRAACERGGTREMLAELVEETAAG